MTEEWIEKEFELFKKLSHLISPIGCDGFVWKGKNQNLKQAQFGDWLDMRKRGFKGLRYVSYDEKDREQRRVWIPNIAYNRVYI